MDQTKQPHRPVLKIFLSGGSRNDLSMNTVLRHVKSLAGEQIDFIEMDINDHPQEAESYQISVSPSLLLLVDDKVVWRHAGLIHTSELYQALRTHLQLS